MHDIEWKENDTPCSSVFSDVYYSVENGLEESRHVFLSGNDLPERFKNTREFRIGELGFGTGLNFLAAWQAWTKAADASARLHYLSFERFPLSRSSLERALSRWGELKEFSDDLLRYYPTPLPGLHRLVLGKGRVFLTLGFGDANELLPATQGGVDAWFLDGFAPARNPELWNESLFKAMADASRRGASFATFSSARIVKDGAKAAGFKIRKLPGFGRKREMLAGELEQGGIEVKREASRRIAVIGGGLAGASAAFSLALRGAEVGLFEAEAEVAGKASGNAQGIFMGYAGRVPNAMNRLQGQGSLFITRQLALLEELGLKVPASVCGVLHLPSNERLTLLLQSLPDSGLPEDFVRTVSAEEAREICGVELGSEAIYYPQGGWVSPPALCRALLSAPLPGRIELRTSVTVSAFEQEGSGWRVRADNNGNDYFADALVIAAAYQCLEYPILADLPLRRLRGQVMQLPSTERSEMLRAVVCHNGYLTPAFNGEHFLGATFDRENQSTAIIAEQEEQLLEQLRKGILGLKDEPFRKGPGRAAIRTTVPDHLPLAGAVESHPGLYLSVGHGSRGLVTCALAGELIAAQLYDEIAPLERDLSKAISPMRYLKNA